jgi:hypothetical protein
MPTKRLRHFLSQQRIIADKTARLRGYLRILRETSNYKRDKKI